MRPQNTFSLEPRLLDGTDRRDVLRCRLGVDPPQAKLERGPSRGDSKGARTDSSAARLGEHRNGETSNLLVFTKLDVQKAQGAIARRVDYHEWRSLTCSPLLRRSRDEIALPLAGQRLVLQPPPRLGIVGCVRDRRRVAVFSKSQHDHSVAERLGRNQRRLWH